jgi:hypothetical protein
MAEFNRHTFPAGGGWTFRQPQTGWTNPMAMVGFDASVKAILKHRQANKAVCAKYKLSTDPATITTELENYTRLRLGIPLPAPPSFFQRRSSPVSRVVGVAADIKRAAQGTAVVLDWLTSGGAPVAQALANKRAAVCATCPKNVEGSWYTVAPAELIKDTLEARKDLTLATPHDASLKSCGVCLCLMKLKVWTPLHFIVDHTKPDIMREFPPHCWIAKRDQ